MKKETIRLEAIKQDLLKVVDLQLSTKLNWLFSQIIPITLLAILVCILVNNIFVIILVFLIAVFHITRFTIKYREYKKSKKEILSLTRREDISISKKIFNHISSEVIYDPHQYGTKARTTKSVNFYYFDGGTSWRVPNVSMHYSWSNEFNFSLQGLDNISIAGDEFFLIGLQNQPDIAYIYPCKYFELDENLIK